VSEIMSMPTHIRHLAALTAIGVLAATATAAEALTYVLTPRPADGRLDVELSWQTQGRSQSALCVSERWGAANDIVRLLENVQLSGAALAGREGPCWLLAHRPNALVQCRYSVTAGRRELDWDAVHLPVTTAGFFHGVGNTFLLAPRPGQDTPQEYEVALRWQVPENWMAVCSWAVGRHVGALLKVDDLRHSVYLAGRLSSARAAISEKADVTVAVAGSTGFSVEDFAELAAGIIGAQCKFMADPDFPPFVVTAITVSEPLEAGRTRLVGTGLYRSFALFISPQTGLNDGVEHLFAHENFHYWNGRLLRADEPQGLVMWFTEGLTDYYALRILYESRHWSAEQYAQWINRHLREYDANPARNATNEEIQAGFWRQRETLGEVPYQRGLLLGLRWHCLARQQGVDAGLDRLFKELVTRGRREGLKLTNSVIRRTGVELLGQWFAEEFDRFVERAETVIVPADALGREFVGRQQAVYAFELGFEREESLKKQRVSGLRTGSAAAKAGLRDGDELIGWHIPADSNQKVVLDVLRRGKVIKIAYYPRGERREILQFRPARPQK